MPRDLFEKIGLYVTTCGHIEYFAWLSVCLADQESLNTVDEVFKIKKRTRKVLNSYRELGERLGGGWKQKVAKICQRIEGGLPNRDRVIHGFWHVTEEGLMIEHLEEQGSGEDRVWVKHKDPITESDIEFSLNDADEILQNVLDVYREIVMRFMPHSDASKSDG